jgi:alpha-L-fucosidase
MNRSWGFNITDRNFKSAREIVGYLVRAAGEGANLLLNVGPRPDGTIQPEAVERLEEIGRWLQTYGPSIYGTRRGPVSPQAWGATTTKGDVVYVHVLDAEAREITLPPLGRRIGQATLLGSRQAVAVAETATGLTIALPPGGPTDFDRVVVLEPAKAKAAVQGPGARLPNADANAIDAAAR